MSVVEVNTPPLKILHVTAALGGGVATAIQDYIASTPTFDHHLLGVGPREFLPSHIAGLTGSIIPLPAGHAARVRAVRYWVENLKPGLVHAHSSYAGIYVRLGLPRRVPVVYTPHCFGFARTDLNRGIRFLLWCVEAILSLRGGLIAAAGSKEAHLARQLPGRLKIISVPPTVRVSESLVDLSQTRPPQSIPEIVMVGRACPQKDPGVFAEAAAISRSSFPRARWTWVGDGSLTLREMLKESGVYVTGWLTHEEVMKYLLKADVYVHTAAWEAGVPLSMLEAANAGLPILASNISATSDLTVGLFDTPQQLAGLAKLVCDDRLLRDRMVEASRDLAQTHPPLKQQAKLKRVYELAIGRSA